MRLFPIANTDVSVRVFPKAHAQSGTVWYDFVRIGTHEAVGKPANVRLFAVEAGDSLEEILGFSKVTGVITPVLPSEETYLVKEGDRMRAYVDEVRATDFLIPLVEDMEADLVKQGL